jgi:selenoprotein W-related protein
LIKPQHTIRVEYCCPCNYLDRVVEFHKDVLLYWGPIIKSVETVPLSWGMFEVFLNGELIFSKWALERHAEEGELVEILRERIGPELSGYVRSKPAAA